MNERAISVLDNYELTMQRSYKGRGSIICETEQGLYILKEFTGREQRILEINSYLKALKENGFLVETYIRNKESRYICQDREQKNYVLKDYFKGNECQIEDENQLQQAFAYLGRLQKTLQSFGTLPEEELPEEMEAAEENAMENDRKEESENSGEQSIIRTADAAKKDEEFETSEEQPKNRIADFAEGCREVSFQAGKDGPEAKQESIENEMPRGSRLLADTRKKNRELRHIRKYLKAKRNPSGFEEYLKGHYEPFFVQAQEVEKQLEQTKTSARAILCHGDFQYHNLLFTEEGIAVINFEKMQYDDATRDLAMFFRKVMEKTGWNTDLAGMLLQSYSQQYAMTKEEYQLFLFRISYPEKFRKIVNNYMNSRKLVLFDKSREKIERLLQQEKARQDCISYLKDFASKQSENYNSRDKSSD